MLFFLTGDIQTGKTRWLQRMLDEVAERGMRVNGVIAPGVWREHRVQCGDCAESAMYEKLGIDNVLLPEGRRIAFARRVDLVDDAEWDDACGQARAAGLAWAIRDEAIREVNTYFADMLKVREEQGSNEALGGQESRPHVLTVVDELGRLELLCNQGLTAAMDYIDSGASTSGHHALVVVRQQLLDCARERFAHTSWGGIAVIGPNEMRRKTLLDAFYG